MLISLPLRGITHRILISDDGVTFADPRVSPALTASERESVLAYVAAKRRAQEPEQRMLARMERGARRAAAGLLVSILATMAPVGLARANDGPLSSEAGFKLLAGAVLLTVIAVAWDHVRDRFWPRTDDDDPLLEAHGDIPAKPYGRPE
jgi:hypothetical protein